MKKEELREVEVLYFINRYLEKRTSKLDVVQQWLENGYTVIAHVVDPETEIQETSKVIEVQAEKSIFITMSGIKYSFED